MISFQLGERLTSLMTGSPPIYSYRRPRIGNSTGVFVNQAQVVVADISARSYRGDQQVCLNFLILWDIGMMTLISTNWRTFFLFYATELVFKCQLLFNIHSPICRITAYATLSGKSFKRIFIHVLVKINGAWKIVSSVASGFKLATSWK